MTPNKKMEQVEKASKMRTKLFFSCIVFCFAWQANAQTEFAPIGAEWYYTYTFGYSPEEHFNRVISEKDTIVEENNCRVLRQYYDNSNVANEEYIIKQEQGKVYYYYQDKFNLLFDFDAKVNDIVEFSFMGKAYFFDRDRNPPFYDIDTVFSVRSVVENITTNAQGLKTFTTKILEEDRLDTYFPYSYTYTEKIGLQSEFILKIESEYFLPEYPPNRFLRCYSDANFSFVSDEWAATSLPCNYSITTSINALKDDNITIYPNPFSDSVFVFTNNVGNLEIIDVSGKVVYYSKLSNGINEISASHFLKGIYLVKIQNKDNSIQTFKIVKI